MPHSWTHLSDESSHASSSSSKVYGHCLAITCHHAYAEPCIPPHAWKLMGSTSYTTHLCSTVAENSRTSISCCSSRCNAARSQVTALGTVRAHPLSAKYRCSCPQHPADLVARRHSLRRSRGELSMPGGPYCMRNMQEPMCNWTGTPDTYLHAGTNAVVGNLFALELQTSLGGIDGVSDAFGYRGRSSSKHQFHWRDARRRTGVVAHLPGLCQILRLLDSCCCL